MSAARRRLYAEPAGEGRTVEGRTDRRTGGQADRRTGDDEAPRPPPRRAAGGRPRRTRRQYDPYSEYTSRSFTAVPKAVGQLPNGTPVLL